MAQFKCIVAAGNTNNSPNLIIYATNKRQKSVIQTQPDVPQINPAPH